MTMIVCVLVVAGVVDSLALMVKAVGGIIAEASATYARQHCRVRWEDPPPKLRVIPGGGGEVQPGRLYLVRNHREDVS